MALLIFEKAIWGSRSPIREIKAEIYQSWKSSQHASSCGCMETEGFLALTYACVHWCMCTLCMWLSGSSRETPRTVCLWRIQNSLPQRDRKETKKREVGREENEGGGKIRKCWRSSYNIWKLMEGRYLWKTKKVFLRRGANFTLRVKH